MRGVRIFDITDISEPEERRQRADLPRLAHAHGAGRSEGHGERLHLHLGFGRLARPRAGGLRRARRRTGSQLGAVPHRGHQGAARASRAGGDRELATHLQRSRGAGPHGERRRTSPTQGASGGREGARAGSSRTSGIGEEIVLPAGFMHPCSTASSRRAAAPARRPAADSAALRAALPGIVAKADRGSSRGARRREPVRSATTSPSIRRRPGGRRLRRLRPPARHQATRRIRCASTLSPTPTSPTGTRPRSTTTAPRSSSPTNGAAAARRSAARPTRRNGAPTRSSRSRTASWCSRATTSCRRRRPSNENCVAHNGSLIPIPGRDVMVQAWYQGGVSVFDWTDAGIRRRSPSSIAARWTHADGGAARGRCTGTTATS